MSDDELLRSLFQTATRDLHAPEVQARPRTTVVPLPDARPARRAHSWPRRALLAGTAAATGAAATLVTVLGFGVGTSAPAGNTPGSGPGAAATATATTSTGSAVLYQLAASVRALPTPTGRYAVQIERQTEQGTSYLKATIIDSRTGDAWTYQRGPGVPATLPEAPGFSPTEAQLQQTFPTDPAQLKRTLVAQASAGSSAPSTAQSPTDLAVTQAIDTLWNPLVQPALRAALVSVIASAPGVDTDAHATDSRGRPAIKIGYDDAALGVRLSVFLDPSTGAVLENSEQPYTATANPALSGNDVYLTHYWTDTPPTVNPLDRPHTP